MNDNEDDKHPNTEEETSTIEEDSKLLPGRSSKPVNNASTMKEEGSTFEEDSKLKPGRSSKSGNNASTKKKTLLSKAQIAGIAEGAKMPRRFKSAFIIYSSMRHSQIKKELASKGSAKKTTDIAKLLSKEWKEMSPTDKAVWEEKSQEDKARYDAEKSFWKFTNRGKASKRIMKDQDAPKRPMSAFLAFSNERRAELKQLHPGVSNGGLSKMLSEQWKELDPESKAKYVKKEAELRAKYKADMAEFRKKKSAEAKMNKKLEDAVEVKKMEERLLLKANTEQEGASPDVQQAAGSRNTDGISSLRAYQDGNAVLSSLLGGGADVARLSNMNSLLLSGAGGYAINPSLMGVSGLDPIAALSGAIPNDRLALALSHQQLLDRLQTEQSVLLGHDLQYQHALQNLQEIQNRSSLERALAAGGNVNFRGLQGLYQPGYASMEQQHSADTHRHYSLGAQYHSSLEAQHQSSLEAQNRSFLEAQRYGRFGYHEGSSGQQPHDRRYDY